MTTKKHVKKAKKQTKAALRRGKKLGFQRTLSGPVDGHTFR